MVKPLVPPAIDILGPYLTTPQSVALRPGRVGDPAGSGYSWWRDCTDDNSEDGTPITAEALNNFKAQLLTFLLASGASINDTDEMTTRTIRAQRLTYVATVGGTANALTVTLDPAPVDYAEINGARFLIVPSATNTGPATVTFNGLGAINCLRLDGTALKPGDLLSGQPATGFVYSGAFRLLDTAKQSAKGLRYKSSATQALSANVNSSVTFMNTLVRNDFAGTPWNTATGVFTAPFEGWYDIAAWLQCATADRFLVKLETTSGTTQTMQNRDTAPTADVADRVVLVSGNFYLTAGQTLALTCIQESSGARSMTNGEISIYNSPT